MSDKCRLDLKTKFEGIKDEEIQAIADHVESLIEQSNVEGISPNKLISDFVRETERSINIDRAQRVMNVKKMNENREFINQVGFDDPVQGLEALIATKAGKNYKGKTASINANTESIVEVSSSKWLEAIDRHPEEFKAFRAGDKTLEKDVYLVLGGSREGVSDAALDIADGMRKIWDYEYNLKTDAGFGTRYIENYMGPQIHDGINMHALGDTKWKKLAEDTFDFDRMGVDPTDVDKFLTQMYDKRMKGLGKRSNLEVTTDRIAFKSLGSKFERSRKVHFKQGDSAFKYNEALGNENLFARTSSTIRSNAKKIAAAQVMGPRFELTYNKLKDDIRTKAALEGRDALNKVKERLKKTDEKFDFALRGSKFKPYSRIAQFGKMARQITDTISLGVRSLFSTMTDFPLAGAVISARTGKNMLGVQAGIAQEFIGNFPSKKNKIKAAKHMIAFSDEIISAQYNTRFGDGGPLTNVLDKVHNAYMRVTGLPNQALSMRQGIATRMSAMMGEQVDTKFSDLYQGTRETLNTFGLGDDWDNIVSKSWSEVGDERFLDPNMVEDLPDSVFGDLSARQIEKKKRDLSLGIVSLLKNTAEEGSPTPGFNQQFLKSTFDPNTVLGQTALMILQYKSFILSQFETMATISKTGGGKHGNIGLVAATAVNATAVGYLALAAKDLMKGREVRDPTEVGTWVDAVAQSGVGLIYMDYMSRDYSKNYINLGADIAGPFIGGPANDFMEVFAATMRKDKNLGKKFLKKIEKNTPSLFFSRQLLNKYFFENAYKALNGSGRSRRR